ncbi:MAG: hypothetical protein OXU62_09515 [Gammaproteobacteria bacterium]|nr:hypothetical protein [Gammaproteobacteria bacterium]
MLRQFAVAPARLQPNFSAVGKPRYTPSSPPHRHRHRRRTVIATVAATVAAHEPSPDKIAREFIQPIGLDGRANALH